MFRVHFTGKKIRNLPGRIIQGTEKALASVQYKNIWYAVHITSMTVVCQHTSLSELRKIIRQRVSDMPRPMINRIHSDNLDILEYFAKLQAPANPSPTTSKEKPSPFLKQQSIPSPIPEGDEEQNERHPLDGKRWS